MEVQEVLLYCAREVMGTDATDGGGGRQQERVTINKEFASFDAFVSDYVSNISRSGVFVRSESPLPVGTRVNLQFTVLMDQVETIEGEGRVVRVHSDPSGMGVVFTQLSAYSKQLIERLLTRGAAAGAPDDGAAED